jgi:hypothetical protein
MNANAGEWGKWFRDNFDKLLLCSVFIFMVAVVIHMTHDQKDKEQILWARELAGTFAGGLLGLITGHALASKTTTTTGPATSSAQVETK